MGCYLIAGDWSDFTDWQFKNFYRFLEGGVLGSFLVGFFWHRFIAQAKLQREILEPETQGSVTTTAYLAVGIFCFIGFVVYLYYIPFLYQ